MIDPITVDLYTKTEYQIKSNILHEDNTIVAIADSTDCACAEFTQDQLKEFIGNLQRFARYKTDPVRLSLSKEDALDIFETLSGLLHPGSSYEFSSGVEDTFETLLNKLKSWVEDELPSE